LVQYLRSLKLLLLILLAGGLVALVERHQTDQHDHLLPRAHPRGEPQLKGESLQELAQVLLELYPQGAEPNLLMGTALAEQGLLQEARLHLEKALEIDRRNQQLLFLYARLLLDLGEQPEKVKAVVEELRRYFPRSRDKVEEYFEQASKGKIRFRAEGAY
jgi:hypothetical protein